MNLFGQKMNKSDGQYRSKSSPRYDANRICPVNAEAVAITYSVSLLEEQFCEVGSVLSGDTGDESNFSFSSHCVRYVMCWICSLVEIMRKGVCLDCLEKGTDVTLGRK